MLDILRWIRSTNMTLSNHSRVYKTDKEHNLSTGSHMLTFEKGTKNGGHEWKNNSPIKIIRCCIWWELHLRQEAHTTAADVTSRKKLGSSSETPSWGEKILGITTRQTEVLQQIATNVLYSSWLHSQVGYILIRNRSILPVKTVYILKCNMLQYKSYVLIH